ncbi:MAG TPA: dihydrofolate reductase [Xanthobacteraceae bacterium]|nr:dihydrofolate reductase [Xanthobacteraceae bacterium]
MTLPSRIEGYAIVSTDGMLADASGIMPEALKFDADQRFFAQGLDGVDAVAHGRHSHEQQPHSDRRRRLILTRRIAGLAKDPDHAKALLWNPAGASFEQAWDALALPGGSLAVIGGTDVFGMFLPRYDVFYLTRAPTVRLPGGRPVFPQVPACTPEQVLTQHGFTPDAPRVLDAVQNILVVSWRRSTSPHGSRGI